MGMLAAVATSLSIYSAAYSLGVPVSDPAFTITQWSSMDNCKAAVVMAVENEKQIISDWQDVPVRNLKDGEFGMAIKYASRYREFVCRPLH